MLEQIRNKLKEQQAQIYNDPNNLIMSERKTPGIQWEILLDGKPVIQYSYFVNL